MQVLVADALGFCFGVRDALAAAVGTKRPGDVTIYGELVHNQTVVQRLAGLGLKNSGENEREHMPDTPLVMITAHGVSDRERSRLESAGKQLIDTTCPLV